MSVVLQLLYDIKPPSWIIGNTAILTLNEPVYISDGRYAFGDGVTQVQALTFFGGGAGSGSVTSVQATVGGALSVSGGPITGAGTLAFTWAGTNSQQILGDGSLTSKITNNNQLINGSGFVLSAGQTSTVDLNTQTLLAGAIGGTYLQAFDNINGSVTVKAQNQNSGFFSQFNLTNDNNTVRAEFQLKNTTFATNGIYIPGGAYLESDGPRTAVVNYGTGSIDFATGVYSAGVSPTIKASISSAGVFQINTLKIGSSSTSGYVWTATDTVGNGSWQAASGGGGSPAGSNTEVQFNNSGAFGSSANLTYASSGLNIGTATRTSQRTLRVGTGTDFVDIGQYQASSGYGAIYFNQSTPGGTNYGFLGNSSDTYLNATNSVTLAISDTPKMSITSALVQVRSGIAFQLGNAFVSGPPSNTTVGYVVIKDSAGNDVQVICWK